MLKKIVAGALAIGGAFIAVSIIFWLMKLAFKLVTFTVFAIGIAVIAIPLYLLIKNKIIK